MLHVVRSQLLSSFLTLLCDRKYLYSETSFTIFFLYFVYMHMNTWWYQPCFFFYCCFCLFDFYHWFGLIVFHYLLLFLRLLSRASKLSQCCLHWDSFFPDNLSLFPPGSHKAANAVWERMLSFLKLTQFVT